MVDMLITIRNMLILFIGCKVVVIVGESPLKSEPYFTSSSGTHHPSFGQDNYFL